jgi:hypothetical protein
MEIELYKYEDLDGDHTLSRDAILDLYWDYWSGQMLKVGKSPLITEQCCIEDWMIVNWAQRIK